MHMSSRTLAALLLLLAGLPAQGSTFENRPLKEVLDQAKAENKLGFVDFYANWCDPCKYIDATMFPDPKVQAWLKEHAIPVAIDGERGQGPDVRKKYDLKFYPTLLLLNADGTERGRYVGTLSPEEFLSTFEDLRNGTDRLGALEKAVSENPQDFEKRAQLVQLLEDKDMADRAREHLEILAQGDTGLAGSAAAQLLAGEKKDEKQEKAIDARIDSLMKTTLDGKATLGQQEALVSLLANRKRAEDLVKLEAALRGQDLDPSLRFGLARRVVNAHIEAKRLDEAITAAKSALEAFEKAVLPADAPANDKWDARYRLSFLYGQLYEAQLLAGKPEEARATAEKSLAQDQDVNNYNRLAWAAFEAEKSDEYALSLANKGHQMAKGEDLNMADTLANVLHQMGRSQEALQVIDAAMKTTTLEKRLKEFKELRESITNPKKADEKKS